MNNCNLRRVNREGEEFIEQFNFFVIYYNYTNRNSNLFNLSTYQSIKNIYKEKFVIFLLYELKKWTRYLSTFFMF